MATRVSIEEDQASCFTLAYAMKSRPSVIEELLKAFLQGIPFLCECCLKFRFEDCERLSMQETRARNALPSPSAKGNAKWRYLRLRPPVLRAQVQRNRGELTAAPAETNGDVVILVNDKSRSSGRTDTMPEKMVWERCNSHLSSSSVDAGPCVRLEGVKE